MRLRRLYYLDASHNSFSDPLPPDLKSYATLRLAYLNHNQFTGTIPQNYVYTGKNRLMELSLNDNRLCGGVPLGGLWHDYLIQKHIRKLRHSLTINSWDNIDPLPPFPSFNPSPFCPLPPFKKLPQLLYQCRIIILPKL